MKPLHPSSTVIITAPFQRKVIERLEHQHLEDGGAIFAQVFHDGLRVRVLTQAQSAIVNEAFAKALGTSAPARIARSVFEAGGAKP